MGVIGGNPSLQMHGLGIIFQSEKYNSMISEALEEYALASAEADYESPGEQSPMGFIASG